MPNRSLIRWPHIVLIVLVVAVLGAGGWYAYARSKPKGGEAARAEGTNEAPPVAVDVVHPQPGGIRRLSTQPGSVMPLEAASLYAKVSGFLAEQSVDIGSRVKQGQVLARISVPEFEKQVERDSARVNNAKAKVKQMEAHLVAAKAESRAADAAVVLATVLVKVKTHFRKYRETQLERIKSLVAKHALDDRTQDEQEEYYLSSVENENAARENVNTAQERAAAAKARITQAEADVEEARSEVGVAQAELAKSQVWLDYAVIRSPYTGVVTLRTFLVGDFIKAADQGGNQPLLTVESTDVMRVVIQVPDRDVPYVHLGAPAIVEIDALPGEVYETKGSNKVGISRWADAEDPTSRTMRTEVDVKNTDGKLRHGMYGRATLILSEGTPNAMRVPSAALVGKAEGGRGAVRVVRDGKVHLVPVRYATDNGVEAEIVSGVTKTDQVIIRTTGPVEEGAAVSVSEETPADSH
jgi:HlyD family secretion protein